MSATEELLGVIFLPRCTTLNLNITIVAYKARNTSIEAHYFRHKNFKLTASFSSFGRSWNWGLYVIQKVELFDESLTLFADSRP